MSVRSAPAVNFPLTERSLRSLALVQSQLYSKLSLSKIRRPNCPHQFQQRGHFLRRGFPEFVSTHGAY